MAPSATKEKEALKEETAKRDPSAPLTMEDALDLEAEGWNPEPGAKLVGQVVFTAETDGGHPEFQTKEEPTYPVVTIITDDGELVALHAFHTVLRRAVRNQDPQRGDRIGVKYVGRKSEGGAMGTGYEAYNVIVNKAESDFSRPALTSGAAKA